mmetsp:Transcript_3128/g.7221  ORF Transcript_3128/g.7221 Transcript_3128/m.7221 type:complete len:256 (-) Transcript_3128:266-1033(-)
MPLRPAQKSRKAAAAPIEVRDRPRSLRALTGLPRPFHSMGLVFSLSCRGPPPPSDFSKPLPLLAKLAPENLGKLRFPGKLSGTATTANTEAKAATAAAHLNTNRGPLRWVRIPPLMAPTMKANPTLRPCSRPRFLPRSSAGLRSRTIDWVSGSMHEVTPSTARPRYKKGRLVLRATVSQPRATPDEDMTMRGLRPTWSETAPQNPTNRKVKSWSIEVKVPYSETPREFTLSAPPAEKSELQKAGRAGAVMAILKK